MNAKELGATMFHPVDTEYGITLREAFAMAAMQGCTTRGGPPGDIATYAVGCADALLAELAKEQA